MAAKLSVANPEPRCLPGPQLLHHLILSQYAPEKMAIEHTFQDGTASSLSYEAFHMRAEELSKRIRSCLDFATSRKRFIVPLLLPQCPELYISQLAILKAGAAFCPIVLDAPEERLRFILDDVEASILLTTAALRSQLPMLEGITILAVDQESDDRGSHGKNVTINPTDAAYIMYTSGSTGQPKGVILSHRAACQALLAHDTHIPPFRRFLQFASPTFDVSVFEIFFPWFRGSTLVSCDRRRLLNDLPAAIRDLSIDACELTPSVASSLLRGRESVPDLKVLLTIGEMLKPSVVEEFGGDSSQPAILHGMYGPTEATIHCTLQPSFPQDMSCNSIGIPLDTVSAFVLKVQDFTKGTHSGDPEILPVGSEGELAIGGYQLADGYLNREEQTRATFVQHSHYGRLYRTGDRAKMLSDGSLHCLGRIASGQVKLRGQRIELGEIEYAASRTPGCRDAVAEVLLTSLVVFCLKGDPSVTEEHVTATCRQWLPAFMVPGDVVLFDEFPQLPSGKCDRKALRATYDDQQARTVKNSAKAEIGEDMRQILGSLSHILEADITPETSLGAVGLDSISSVKVVSELRERGLPQLDAGHLLTARTPWDILSAIEAFYDVESEQDAMTDYIQSVYEEVTGALSGEQVQELETAFPCTPVQLAMLAETIKDPRAYCNWIELSVANCESFNEISQAVNEVASWHALLRAGFISLPSSEQSFATLVWRTFQPEQIKQVKQFDYGFSIEDDRGLLRPVKMQVLQEGGGPRLLLSMHHALYDQWSIDLLQADLSNALKGTPRPKSASYQDVAQYYIAQQGKSETSSVEDYWRDYLRDVTATTIPLLRSDDVPRRLNHIKWHDTALETTKLRKRSQELGCSVPAMFQTALAYVLSCYAGTSDVTFGTVFSGRTLPVRNIDSVFGPCLATLPFRIDYKTAHTIRDLISAVTERNRQMQRHLTISPTVIREVAGMSPGVSLFDTLFVWQESTVNRDTNSAVRLVDAEDQLEFNLTLEFEPSATNIKVQATYNEQLLGSEQVNIIIRQIEKIVMHVLAEPDDTVQGLSSSIPPDLLSIANSSPVAYAHTFDLPSAIAARAKEHPSASAILFANDINERGVQAVSITYAELDARANQIANLLLDSGLKPEGLVCICMEKRIDLYVAMLACFKAGAGYLPLVPETPHARIKSVLAQAHVQLCVGDIESTPLLSGATKVTVLNVDTLDLSKCSKEPPAVPQIGSRTAYAVFTSGSTGQPKGVAVSMDNLKGNLAVLADLYTVSPTDRLLQSCSQAFDVSVFEIFFAFYTGMCLCSATKENMFRDLEHSVRMFEATHLSMTPTVAGLVNPENVPSVKFLVTAGEGITEKVHRLWAGCGLHQGYGPSETTNICSAKMNVATSDVLGGIGPPFRNTSAFVLAPEGDFEILPTGSYGEFAFGGEQVFNGYIGREDLNSTKIVDHPEYGRIYRSGDMGRILADGSLLIAGRLDDQVKIRGNRVELGEINAVVSVHPDVVDCTTIMQGSKSVDRVLVTFWVPKSGANEIPAVVNEKGLDLVAEIYERLEAAMPAYMIPNVLVPLTVLPMTSQGKLDKRKLQAIFKDIDDAAKDRMSRSHEVSNEDSPASPTESGIAEIISEILNMAPERVPRNGSLFALGINSLNAIQLAKGIEQTFHARVSVTAILRHASVAKLARAVDVSGTAQTYTAEINIQDVFDRKFLEDTRNSFQLQDCDVESILPCTPLQEAMLSAASGTEAYCNTTKLSFDGDMTKLKACWEEMCRRHTILRTTFIETAAAAYPFAQVILKQIMPRWQISEESRSKSQANGEVNGHANVHANGYTNGAVRHLANGDTHRRPVLGGVTPRHPVRVVQHARDIYIQMHHAVYDGISMSNLYREIFALYREEQLPVAVSFEPFLAEVMKHNTSEAMDFWRPRFSDFMSHPFPAQDDPKDAEEQVYEHSVDLPSAEISSFTERHSCTSTAVLQAAWAKTLACLQGVNDICFGNVVSGRSVGIPDIDRLVAPCFNTIPLRVKLDRVCTNFDLVQLLHQTNVECLQYQLAAPRRVQSVSKDPSRRLFDSLLLVQPPVSKDVLNIVEDHDMDMGFPLVIEVTPHDESLHIQLHYMPVHVPDKLVCKIVDGFVGSLRSILKYPSSQIGHMLDVDKTEVAKKLAPKAASGVSGESSAGENDPWSSSELLIKEAFAELANIATSRISKGTSLYQIGLDSLNAVQVASKLRSRGMQVDAADIMQHQTPSAIANAAAKVELSKPEEGTNIFDLDEFSEKHGPRISNSLKLDSESVEHVWPCTSAQSGMLAQYIQSGGQYYFSHSIYEVPGEYSNNAISAAWAAVQQKHQMLRTGFAELEDATWPFAMIVYKDSKALLDGVWVKDTNAEDAKPTLSNDVFASLHRPAWRFAIFEVAGGRRMCLSIHHALYDADSLALLLRDFRQAVRGISLGKRQNVGEALVKQLDGAGLNKNDAKDFWTSALQSAHLVKFPNLAPITIKATGADTSERKSKVEVEVLNYFCKREGITIQALAQSLWAQLLAAYQGEEEVTFGTVFSGLSGHGEDAVAFPAITTVPVYCNVKQPSMDLVHDMVSYNSSAQRYRFTSLTDIQRYAGSPGQALFDTIFVYQKSSSDSEEYFDWRPVENTLGIDYTASMELETPTSGAVLTRLTYHVQAITEHHAELMLEQYDALLQELLAGDQRTTELDKSLFSIVPPKEYTLPCNVDLLHQFLERGARENPDKPALEFIYSLEDSPGSRKIWTYKELNDRCNQVAHLLQEHGVKSGSIVAVCMDKSPEATFAFVGILKAGCAFLAMDPELPLARRKFILEDSSSQLLFVDQGKIDAELDMVHNVELIEKSLVEFPITPVPVTSSDPSATSYCLYTSGTTGTPKGCELTHENAVQAMMSFQRLFEDHWTESSRWLQFASYWFDVSVLEHFWSWSVGITMVGAPRDLVLEDIPAFIRAANITHIDLTPSLARLLKPEDVPSLHNHVFITGGEALKQEIIDAWGPLHTIYNGYGPTEATIGVTMNVHIGPLDKPSNIGPPFDNVGIYVFVPDSDEPVLRGAVGELCISGKLVGKGYLNRPELTAKAFPYLERFGERVYRTGDLVRLLADGSVSFIGRKDTQAKLRGQRLEIDEIDAVIKASSTDVHDMASLVVKSSDGTAEMLVSFIADKNDLARDLRLSESSSRAQLVGTANQACRKHLPGYMVPTHIIPISRLPLTVNNKVDAKRLNALFESMTTSDLQGLKGEQSINRALRSHERKVAKTLGRLLSTNLEDVAPNANIFSLGLSSVSAINYATLLRRNGFENASVATIMSNVTLERLANALTESSGDSHAEWNAIMQAQLSMSAFEQKHRGLAARALSFDASDLESIAPCTPLQEGLLVESTKSGERPYFNEVWYSLDKLDLDRVEEALVRLCELLPILRTAFIRTDEGFAQVCVRQRSGLVRRLEISTKERDAAIAQQKKDWQGLPEQEVTWPFQALVVHSSEGNVLVLHAHHALYDGISWELMLQRLKSLYEGASSIDAGPSFLEALPYGPLLHREDAKPFWQTRLDGFQYTSLTAGAKGASDVDIEVCRKISGSAQLETLQKQSGVSQQAILQAAFIVALHQISSDTQTFGMVLSGRSINFDDAESIIGPMFNTVPCSLDVDAEDTWARLLQRCQRANAAVLPYQHTSLRDIRRYCGCHPSDPLFDVLFVFQHPVQSHEVETDEQFTLLPGPTHADYLLAVEAEIRGQGELFITAAAQAGVTDEGSLHRLIDVMRVSLDLMSQHADETISDRFAISQRSTAGVPKSRSEDVSQASSAFNFEWTPQASKLRSIITDLAGCEESSVNEQVAIFTLGLDSIDAVKLAARMKKAGVALPVSKILNAQTIPKMLEAANVVQNKSNCTNAASLLSKLEVQLRESLGESNAVDVERVLPAAPSQEALVADMLRSDFKDYFNSDILQIRDHVHLGQLVKALQKVVDATPILRTRFIEVADPSIEVVFAQVVEKPQALEISRIEVDTITDLDDYIEDTRREVRDGFSRASPLRLTIATIEDSRYLVLSLSHAQYDGHSLALIHEDIAKAYTGEYQSRPSYDEAIELALDATGKDSLTFWRNTLVGAKPSHWPRVESVPDARTHRSERASSVSASTARQSCQQLGVSMQALAQTSWALLLAHYLHDLEVIYGVVLACRDSEESEQIIFPTMNTVPSRASLHGNGREMLQYVQHIINEMRQHQRTPLRAIQSACTPEPHSEGANGKSGLFDTLFIYQSRGDTEGSLHQPLYDSVGEDSNVEYPIAVEVEAVDEKLVLRAACKSNALDEQGTDRLLQQLDQVLSFLVQSADRPTVEFSGDSVSICGFPQFKVRNGALSRQSTREKQDVQQSDEESDSGSWVIESIRSALAQVSKVPEEQVSPTTTIDSIGIDSISAIKVASILRKESLKISVSELLRAQTPKQMAGIMKSKSGASPEKNQTKDVIGAATREIDTKQIAERLGFKSSDLEAVRPATAGQLYMASLWQKTLGEFFYPTLKYQLKTGHTIEQLRQSWYQLVEMRAILRTVLVSVEATPAKLVQAILRTARNTFWTERMPTNATPALAHLQAQATADGYKLDLKIHHALYDAVSLPLLVQDLETLLNGYQLGSPGVSFDDFLALSLTSGAQSSQRQFWTQYLSIPELNKTAHLDQPVKSSASRNKVQVFEPSIFSDAAGLERYARASKVSIQALLFALYARIYATRTRGSFPQDEDITVIIGVYMSNRSHLSYLDQLRDPTLNLLPLLVRNVRSTSLIDTAKRIDIDLRKIGSQENSAASLAQVFDWTDGKVRVDTFVNFLRLPDLDENKPDSGNAGSIISDDNNAWNETVAEVKTVEKNRFVMPKGLESFEAHEAYLHAVDVEMSITREGALSLGMFCMEDLMGLGEVEKMVEEFEKEVRKIIEG